ncbi:MAG: indole-3-glycerol phosphate synthase TrpC [Dissulfurimicrobium sp.]|uniref:indole-3-glycerol phosphate synthase TrpC n=1 Tax=Dissulfurimicrobium sp. TaxID=2022436 RepID=UPI00404AB605
MNILDKIVAYKKDEVARLKRKGVSHPEADIAPLRGFRAALVAGDSKGVSVIAEVKRASPSKGLLCPDFDPLAIATDYEKGGASAISVITDEKFFQGSLSFLPLIRSEVRLPLLRKDFIIDHVQIEEARAFGADAVLLIVAVLDFILMKELLHHAREVGLDCLVEVHDENEVELALKAGADLIGVNNRNLKDFSVSLDTTFRLKEMIGEIVPVVSESGISTPEDMKMLRNTGIAAVLIGEGLVRAKDRVVRLAELVKAGRPA